MRIRLTAGFIIVSLLAAVPATAATKQEQRVADATDVIDQILRIPEQSIPPALLSRAYAIAVVPNVVKVGFGVGARRGKGILVIRRDDNSWSNPAFVALTGGSLDKVGSRLLGQDMRPCVCRSESCRCRVRLRCTAPDLNPSRWRCFASVAGQTLSECHFRNY